MELKLRKFKKHTQHKEWTIKPLLNQVILFQNLDYTLHKSSPVSSSARDILMTFQEDNGIYSFTSKLKSYILGEKFSLLMS